MHYMGVCTVNIWNGELIFNIIYHKIQMTATDEVFILAFDRQPLTPCFLGTLDCHRQWSVGLILPQLSCCCHSCAKLYKLKVKTWNFATQVQMLICIVFLNCIVFTSSPEMIGVFTVDSLGWIWNFIEGRGRNAGQESDSPAAAVYGIETKHYKFCCHTPHPAKTAMTNVQLHYIADWRQRYISSTHPPLSRLWAFHTVNH